MSREGIDFSGPPPSVSAMRAAGKDFVVRYARSFTHPKSITSAERKTWQAVGIDIAIVEESSADRALDGRAAGQADAKAARAAIVAIGGPADGVIYSAVDIDASAAQMPAVLDYIRGFSDVLGWDRAGVYGSYDVMKAAHEAGVCEYLWQTYAWSGGQVYPGIHLYQYRNAQTLGGVEVDFCRTSLADFGQWGAQAQPEEDDFDMRTDDQIIALMDKGADRALTRRLTTVGDPIRTELRALGKAGALDALGSAVNAIRTDTAATRNDEAAIKAAVSDAKTAVLAALAALPVDAVLSDAEVAALGEAIAEQIPTLAADDVISALKARIQDQSPDPTQPASASSGTAGAGSGEGEG